MNKKVTYLFLFFAIGTSSCNKELGEPESYFGQTESFPIRVLDTLISKVGPDLSLQVEFAYLSTDLIKYTAAQGNRSTAVSFESPDDNEYDFSFSNVVLESETAVANSSTLVLFDKSNMFPSYYGFDDCIAYWIEHLNPGHEYALGGFSTDFPNGYKIYGNGFVTSDDADRMATVIDIYGSEDKSGDRAPLFAANNAIDWLDSYATYQNKNIVIISTGNTSESATTVNNLISKANSSGVSISVIAGSDHDYSKIATLTNGFYGVTSEEGQFRLGVYSIAKLIEKQYLTMKIQLDIHSNIGSFVGYFGYYFEVDGTDVMFWINT